jgi:hypothetical protein
MRLKTGLKSNCFASLEEIQKQATAGLTVITKQNFQIWLKQWQYCGKMYVQ